MKNKIFPKLNIDLEKVAEDFHKHSNFSDNQRNRSTNLDLIFDGSKESAFDKNNNFAELKSKYNFSDTTLDDFSKELFNNENDFVEKDKHSRSDKAEDVFDLNNILDAVNKVEKSDLDIKPVKMTKGQNDIEKHKSTKNSSKSNVVVNNSKKALNEKEIITENQPIQNNEKPANSKIAKKAKNNATEKKSLHSGHRQRLIKRLEESNFADADDYLTLEYILTLPIMRRDTNEIGHRLVDTFGSLAGVLDASVDELLKVKGVNSTTAHFLHAIPLIFRNYKLSKVSPKMVISTPQDIYNYIGSAIFHMSKEEFYIVCLDNAHKAISKKLISTGTETNASVDIKSCVQYALSMKASKVVIIHNHPSGTPEPSQDDIETTKRMMASFHISGIDLFDHLIVNYKQEYFSFSNAGLIEMFKNNINQFFKTF